MLKINPRTYPLLPISLRYVKIILSESQGKFLLVGSRLASVTGLTLMAIIHSHPYNESRYFYQTK